MLILKNAPTLAVMGREGGSAGASKGEWENSTRSSVAWEGFTSAKRGGLTHGWCWGMVETPNQSSRNRRLALAPQGAEVLSAHTAIFHAPAGSVSGWRRVHIGGVATSSIREDWRLRLSRGALLPRLFFFNPKSIEVPHA